MFEWLVKVLAPVIDSFIKPVIDWILGLRWRVRLALLTCLLLVSVCIWNWAWLSEFGPAAYLVLGDVAAQSKSMPLTRGDMKRIRVLETQLEPIVLGTFDRDMGPPFDSWSAAQTSLASWQLPVPRLSSGIQGILEHAESSGYWKQLPGNEQPENIAVTAWIAYSLLRQGVPAKRLPIEALVRAQSRYGWWATFPGAEADSFASTYATAWSLLAMREASVARGVGRDDSLRYSSACERARSWLLNHRAGPGAEWKDYPHHLQGRTTVSTSAFIVHALLECKAPEGESMAAAWGRTAIFYNVDPDNKEVPVDIWVRCNGDYVPDGSVYYIIGPWVLLANYDAYESCSLMDRVRLVAWTRRFLRRPWDHLGLSAGDEWVASEALLALHYVDCAHARDVGAPTRNFDLGVRCRAH